VLKAFHNRELSFFRLDPTNGIGPEIGRVGTSFSVWSLSLDGSRIALIGNGLRGEASHKGILSMNVRDGAIEEFHIEGVSFPNDVGWSADGRSLFITDLITDARSPGPRIVHPDLYDHVHVLWQTRIVWSEFFYPLPSPDGRYLAFGQRSFESNAWTLENF